jgi:hypothetical protein
MTSKVLQLDPWIASMLVDTLAHFNREVGSASGYLQDSLKEIFDQCEGRLSDGHW